MDILNTFKSRNIKYHQTKKKSGALHHKCTACSSSHLLIRETSSRYALRINWGTILGRREQSRKYETALLQ